MKYMWVIMLVRLNLVRQYISVSVNMSHYVVIMRACSGYKYSGKLPGLVDVAYDALLDTTIRIFWEITLVENGQRLLLYIRWYRKSHH